jgi:ABC-2 type transport system permease protein
MTAVAAPSAPTSAGPSGRGGRLRRVARVPRLFVSTFLTSAQRDVAFRADLVASSAFTALATAGTIVTIVAVFSHVDSLAGRSAGEAVAIVGTFLVINGLLLTFVEPNVELFATTQVLKGGLDEVLLKPAPSLFLATLGRHRPRALVDAVVGIGVVVAALATDGAGITPAGVAVWCVLVAVGFVVAWALRVLLAIGAFWAPGLETAVFFQSVWQLGRFPISVYAPWLRILLSYVLPMALIATVPARALQGHAGAAVVGGAVALAAAAVVVVRFAWRAGLRHYTSATS